MGRTGAWFGFQHYDLQPDVVAIGKGLGNGYPVSAVAMTDGVADKIENSDFRYAQSHQNDPLGCAVAREVITIFQEDGLVERSNRVGTYFLHELRKLGERHRLIKEVRGRGLMIVLELEANDERFSVASLYRDLLARRFLIGYTPAANLLRFYPALTIDEEDIAQLVENLNHILEELV
jgi:acetylornithine aminotransferase